MSALFIDPHGDDIALFCAYTALQNMGSDVLMTNRTVPAHEVALAMPALEMRNTYSELGEWRKSVTTVYAPAFHPDGHEEHNEAYHFARNAFPLAEHVNYGTYAPRAVRQTDIPVDPEPWMVARKLRALSCFVSQIEQESTRPWFTYLLDMREWLTSER